jgi:electron transfer flavoprotein alpha subunit
VIAVVVVRDGALPAGAEETIAECDGHGLLIGSGVEVAAKSFASGVAHVSAVEVEPSDLRALATHLLPLLAMHRVVVLPGSPDGRDLAPVLARRLGRTLCAGAVSVRARDEHTVVVQLSRAGGLLTEAHTVTEPLVATLIPGVRGVDQHSPTTEPTVTVLDAQPIADAATVGLRSVEVLPPDPSTMDLTEARVIVAGGQGLGSTERFDQLGRIGTAIGGSLGGTRVASDAGWIPFERQIGTTGVMVNPRTYLAFAISGATQHVTGLGDPEHIISVNLDASCPMMGMADLAIVADANAVLDELEGRLKGASA